MNTQISHVGVLSADSTRPAPQPAKSSGLQFGRSVFDEKSRAMSPNSDRRVPLLQTQNALTSTVVRIFANSARSVAKKPHIPLIDGRLRVFPHRGCASRWRKRGRCHVCDIWVSQNCAQM